MNDQKNKTSEAVILTEICSKSNKKICYLKLKDEMQPVNIVAKNISSWTYLQRINSLFKDIFLPKGYPNSVSSDYLEYQIWDTCQAFCSSISGTLTIKAIMQGIGVGSEAATPVSAAVTWIIKDGTGMIGSILFAWLKGSKLDSDCKKWRLVADILNDLAMLIQLYIPKVINYSTYMLSFATILKALVGTAGGSTRAAIITHQAIRGNIADVSAKDGSQEIFTNLSAFMFGILLLKNVTETEHVWAVMCIAILFHLIFNYKAVRCLKMNVFNGERYRLTLRSYLPTSSVPTVEQVNRRETVFLGMGTRDALLCGFRIFFGVNLKMAVKSQKMTAHQLSAIITFFQNKKYFILVNIKKRIMNVTFRQNFAESDVLKAYFHAYLIGAAITYLESGKQMHIISRSRTNSPVYRLKNILKEFINSNLNSNIENQQNTTLINAYMTCESFIEKEFIAFCKICKEKGWNMKRHLISVDDWRADWQF